MIRLVLSCGYERFISSDEAFVSGVKDGDMGWCPEHDEATVDAIFVEEEAHA